MNDPIAILGDTCTQVHRFTQVRFIPHELKGRRWMIVDVGVECCNEEFVYSTDEIRDLRDRLSEWLGDTDEMRALRKMRSGPLHRGIRPAP